MKKHKRFYLESLLPERQLLPNIRIVDLILSKDLDKSQRRYPMVGYANPINAHLFKPIYLQKSRSEIMGYCATITVAKHVKKAWEIFSKHFCPLKAQIKIASNSLGDPYVNTHEVYADSIDKLLTSIKIQDRVIIGRIDSLNAFLKLIYLKEKAKVPIEKLKDLFTTLEMHRLKHNLLTIHNDKIFKGYLGSPLVDKLNRFFSFESHWEGRFLGVENVNFFGKKFTVINLPWGQDLAFCIVKSLLEKSSVEKLFVVGGVGCVKDDAEIDDVIVATATKNEKAKKFLISNSFKEIFTDTKKYTSPSGFFSKKVIKGEFLSVYSSLGHKDTFSLDNKRAGISAFDMETFGIIKAVKESNRKTNLFLLHYIMDLPLKGLGLGATYYCETFLKKLLSTFNRGKYFCFDYILYHL